MATDSTLVQGAYDANKGYNIDKTGVSGAINKGQKGLGKAVKKRRKRQEKVEAKRQEELQKEKELNEGLQKGINEAEQIAYDTEDDSYGEDEEEIITSMDDITVEADIDDRTTDDASSNNKDNEVTLATKKSWENAEDSSGIDFAFDNVGEIVQQVKSNIPPSKLKEKGIKVLNTLSNGVQKFKGLKERMLELHENRKKNTGFSKSMSKGTDHVLSQIVSGEIPVKSTTDDNGEVQMGWNIPSGIDDWERENRAPFINMGDLSRILDDNQTDVESQASIIGIRDAQISLAENARPESVFNTEKVRSNIADVVRKGNLKSLVHDETFGGTSFAEDILKSDFAEMTYSSLGISDIYDTDGDGKLTSNDNLSMEDKKAIVEELINNPNNASLLEEEVTNYFTAHIQKNWDMNHKNRPQSNPLPNGSMMNTYKPEQQTNAPSLKVDLPGVPKRVLSEEEKLKAQLEKKNESGYSSMDYLNMIKA
jgi:hypothetical protein